MVCRSVQRPIEGIESFPWTLPTWQEPDTLLGDRAIQLTSLVMRDQMVSTSLVIFGISSLSPEAVRSENLEKEAP